MNWHVRGYWSKQNRKEKHKALSVEPKGDAALMKAIRGLLERGVTEIIIVKKGESWGENPESNETA